MESVLTWIKKMLGITEEYEHFDSDHYDAYQFGVYDFDSTWRWSAIRIFYSR